MGIRCLFQLPHLLRAGPFLPTLLFFPLVPSSYRVLLDSLYYFPLLRYSCPLSAGVLHALLCLKVYTWCIHGERCTPHPPTPPPSCSPLQIKLLLDVRVGLWRRLSAKELMLLKCGVGEDSWESLGLQGDPTSPFWRRSALGFLWKEWY